MQAGKADNRKQVKDSRQYAADKPNDCRHCYFWKGRRKGCSQKECYYLLSEERLIQETMEEEVLQWKADKNSYGDCQNCPYGRDFPCIGYCMQKILREMKERKRSTRKEEEHLAGRGK